MRPLAASEAPAAAAPGALCRVLLCCPRLVQQRLVSRVLAWIAGLQKGKEDIYEGCCCDTCIMVSGKLWLSLVPAHVLGMSRPCVHRDLSFVPSLCLTRGLGRACLTYTHIWGRGLSMLKILHVHKCVKSNLK